MKILNFYGIKFYDVDYKTCLDLLKKKGGYLVIPAASSLATIKDNKKYYNLIMNFKLITGIPIVLNTSFNENEPIVLSPE